MTEQVAEYFHGFAIDKPENWNRPKLVKYKHKPLNSDDVVIKVEYCGVCGTDVHTVRGHWGDTAREDLVVGHEIVGRVVWTGHKVTTAKVGQTVGIGAQSGSCEQCSNCKNGIEQYCDQMVFTYNQPDPKAGGYVTQGGYADYAVSKDTHVFPIPEGLPPLYAAPLLCGGLTVFSPLREALGLDARGKTVGVIGIGGLGHMAIQFAAAFGAEVVAISRSSAKRNEALSMGATDFIATKEDKDWAKKYRRRFDFILNTATSFSGINMTSVLSTLKVKGTFSNVGVPEDSEKIVVEPYPFVLNGSGISGSFLGSRDDALRMFEIADRYKVRPWVEEVSINEKNVGAALKRSFEGDVRYRFVFSGYDKLFS